MVVPRNIQLGQDEAALQPGWIVSLQASKRPRKTRVSRFDASAVENRINSQETFKSRIRTSYTPTLVLSAMPHSVSPEDPSAPDQDGMIAEAETGGGTQTIDQTMVRDAEANNGEHQINNVVDQDMEMEDSGIEGEDVPQVKLEVKVKQEVKLENLFADMESDEEFPSSTGQVLKAEGSPEPPSSPMQVNMEEFLPNADGS
jgi:hypothetical protein